MTGDANAYFADEYKIITASEAATATQTGSVAWGIMAASFKAASAASTTKRMLLLGVGQ